MLWKDSESQHVPLLFEDTGDVVQNEAGCKLCSRLKIVHVGEVYIREIGNHSVINLILKLANSLLFHPRLKKEVIHKFVRHTALELSIIIRRRRGFLSRIHGIASRTTWLPLCKIELGEQRWVE